MKQSVPKWVTALLLVLDHLLQYKVMIHADAPGGAARTADTSSCVAVKSNLALSDGENPEVEFERDKNLLVGILWGPTGYMTTDEQWTTAVITSLLHMQLPSATPQAVLQLCAQLTKIHTIALQFFDAGGLTVLLILSRSSMYPGFDVAMESEICHTLITTFSCDNGHVSPCMFLTAMAPIVWRDPANFMQAAAMVCQIQTIGRHATMIFAKGKEREVDKNKDKGKEKGKEKVKAHDKDLEKVKSGSWGIAMETWALCGGSLTAHDFSNKSAKGHHYRRVPQCFLQLIDQLLEVVLHYPSHVVAQSCAKEEDLSRGFGGKIITIQL